MKERAQDEHAAEEMLVPEEGGHRIGGGGVEAVRNGLQRAGPQVGQGHQVHEPAQNARPAQRRLQPFVGQRRAHVPQQEGEQHAHLEQGGLVENRFRDKPEVGEHPEDQERYEGPREVEAGQIEERESGHPGHHQRRLEVRRMRQGARDGHGSAPGEGEADKDEETRRRVAGMLGSSRILFADHSRNKKVQGTKKDSGDPESFS